MPKYKIELSTIESMAHVVDREGIAALTEFKGLLKNIMDDHARLMGEPPSEEETPASRTMRDQLTKKLMVVVRKVKKRDVWKKTNQPSGYRVSPLAIQALTRDIRMGSAAEEDNQELIKAILSDHARMLGKWFPGHGEIQNPQDRLRDSLTKDLLREMRKARKKKKLAAEIQEGINEVVSRPVWEIKRPRRARKPTRKPRPSPFPFSFGESKPLPPLEFQFKRCHLPNLTWDWDTILEEGDWVRHRGCNGALIMSMDAGQAEDASRGRSTRHLYNADIPKDFKHLRNSLFCCKCGQKVGRRAFRRLKDDPGHFMVDYCDFPELQGRVAKVFMYHVPPPPGHNE